MSNRGDILKAYANLTESVQLCEVTFKKIVNKGDKTKKMLLAYLENMSHTYLFDIEDNSRGVRIKIELVNWQGNAKQDIEEVLAYTKYDTQKFPEKVWQITYDDEGITIEQQVSGNPFD